METIPSRKELLSAAASDGFAAMTAQIPSQAADPKACFEALGPGGFSVLLESASGGPRTGRYSIIGARPVAVFKSTGDMCEITRNGRTEELSCNPLDALDGLIRGLGRGASAELPFDGGAIGYFGYDVGRLFETLPDRRPCSIGLPDACFVFPSEFAVLDRMEGKTAVGTLVPLWENRPASVDKAVARLDDIAGRMLAAKKTQRRPPPALPCFGRPRFNFTRERYEETILRVKEHIYAGDVYQVNLSQRCSIDAPGLDPWALYTVLSEINPSPMAAFLDLGDFQVISASPERLIVTRGRQIEDRPLAGTSRISSPSQYKETFETMLSNEKELAEHRMLIDLERNDLGRICEFGSVVVDEMLVPEVCSHVVHLCSNLKGTLREDAGWRSILRAVFPGGTITGVPKIRCMEILEECEPVRREIFYGSAGYISSSGNVQLNILIRTLVSRAGSLHFQVGGGIVADSVPEKEYAESLAKAEAMLAAMRRYGGGTA